MQMYPPVAYGYPPQPHAIINTNQLAGLQPMPPLGQAPMPPLGFLHAAELIKATATSNEESPPGTPPVLADDSPKDDYDDDGKDDSDYDDDVEAETM